MAGRFGDWWGETPRPVRWTVYTAVPAGGTALVLGLVGDSHGWWEHHEFLTNLMSSFTGLLLGVPFALVVLSHLGSMQADAANRRSAVRRGLEAADRFWETCIKGFSRPIVGEAINDLERLRAANAKLRDRLKELELVLAGLARLRPISVDAAEIRAVARAFDERASVVEAIFVGTNSKQRNAWLAEVVHEWNRLDRDVRPRLEEVGSRWMPAEAYETLRQSGKRLEDLATPAMMPHRRTRQAFDDPDAGIPRPSHDQLLAAIARIRSDTDATLEVTRALLGFLRTQSAIAQIART